MKRAGLALALAGLGLVLAGCGTGHAASHHHQAAPVRLPTVQVCQRLRADMSRNGTYPDAATVAYLGAHAASPALAGDLASLGADLPAVGSAAAMVSADLEIIGRPCYLAGVTVPVPSF